MDRMEQLMEEYKILRSEILYYMNKDTTLSTCLFSGVTAVLFFSIERDIPECCFLSYLIIFPICSKFAYHQKQMAKIASYMSCFLEDELEVKWETRVKAISEKRNRPRKGKFLKFSECPMMAAATVFTFIYLMLKDQVRNMCKCQFYTELILMIALFVVVSINSKQIYNIKKFRKEYEEQMKDIK